MYKRQDPDIVAECELKLGAFERWNGHRGFGPLNAKLAMDRACELAKEYGIGLVALGNNNHWMRGGSYGFQAADQGCIGICWSNTCPVSYTHLDVYKRQGTSRGLLEAAVHARELGFAVVGITQVTDSPISRLADRCLYLG